MAAINMPGAQDLLTSSLFIVRKLSKAFFNAQNGDQVGKSSEVFASFKVYTSAIRVLIVYSRLG
ncbi:unnamed protein product [Haemonchus placei]|uniref:Secreted protein n=1 Tax=Haemonchus placei TaxID=6290 RepID=A0A0N4WNH7_HAEPC|nr:unnamed protein product [Haemonchus placei]